MFRLPTPRHFARRRKCYALLSRAAVSDNSLILESSQGRYARVMEEIFSCMTARACEPGNKARLTRHWQEPSRQVLPCWVQKHVLAAVTTTAQEQIETPQHRTSPPLPSVHRTLPPLPSVHRSSVWGAWAVASKRTFSQC
jgi:hypothetical protein